MNAAGKLIDPDYPEFGTRFDRNQDRFTVYQAAMLWTDLEPAEDGFFQGDLGVRLKLGATRQDPHQVNRSVFDALIVAIERGEFSIIPMRTKDGAIDGYTTVLPRDALRNWAKERGDIPDFLSTGEATPRERRANHDMTRERGCRRRILEQWDSIERLYNTRPDSHQVRRELLKDKDEKKLALKTVQNNLSTLRKEKLIP